MLFVINCFPSLSIYLCNKYMLNIGYYNKTLLTVRQLVKLLFIKKIVMKMSNFYTLVLVSILKLSRKWSLRIQDFSRNLRSLLHKTPISWNSLMTNLVGKISLFFVERNWARIWIFWKFQKLRKFILYSFQF